ncbi:uncharacterized protein LOC107632386 [Arachis ipaensis]|uniref:uncharacterized protein LOC107632386 n=1 Tax=Arachis ipaensis TaxID=130454 RepID=UPI0007AF42CA|nr:uncharacterized protein LOC107632386 [Arachis ipaensis]XP_025641271.1 uncharacterized protein LOC112736149 [Arachis hypogaea]
MADQNWVAEKLEKKLLSQPRLTHAEAWDHIKIDYNVIISDKMLYRGLKIAREKYVGNEKAQYGKLRDYLQELHRSNHGSTALLAVEPIPQSPPLFDKLYVCLDACKKGFRAGCRPLIGLDGCFLKGYYGGQLLSAVAQDANNHFYVIAYAVVASETKESWKWFLDLLQNDLGPTAVEGWNFISDQQKGLMPAMKAVMPNAHHRNCVRHIWKNFTNKYKSKQLKNVVWACAKSSTKAEFKEHMMRLKKVNKDAWAYLAKFDPGCWTKSHFSHWPKLDNITNNMTEVWNAKIVHYRGKPILTMLEELKCYIMRRMAQHKRVLSTYTGIVAPVQQKRIDDIMKECKYWTAQWTGDDARQIFEVQYHMKKVGVDLGNSTCSCNMWQLTGIPCVHAMAAIGKRGDRPEGYVHQWLKMDAFRATYAHSISPVNSEEYWDKSGVVSSIPPKIKRPIGRPVKRRRPDAVEDGPDGTKAKKTFRVTCSKCGDIGHNSKTCKGAPQQGSSSKAKGKKKQAQPQYEMADDWIFDVPLSQNERSVEGSLEIPNTASHETQTENPPSQATTNVSSKLKAQQPFRRPKQTIRRSQVQESVRADTTAATTSQTASGMFKFIPTPGLNQSKKK